MTSQRTTFLWTAVAVLATSSSCVVLAEQVSNWQAYLEPHPTEPDTKYSLVMEWDHVHSETIFVDGENGGRVYNANNDQRCNGSSSTEARDGLPFWMPRFFARPVSEEITRVTGVKFASPDWQPCGHKEITICHAESHYDFHLYYESEADMNSLPLCDIGVSSNPDLPVCRDSATNEVNHEYFKLMNHSIPLRMSTSAPAVSGRELQEVVEKDFCVDATSAVLRSGVHYGDASETKDEWKTPVTIVGSHDCKLTFFEPMFSWKWMSGCVANSDTSYPFYEVKDIEYKNNKKGIESLPDSWSIEVGEECRAVSCRFAGEIQPPTSDICHIKLTARGTKCPEGGCTLTRECSAGTENIKDCSTDLPYNSPWEGGELIVEDEDKGEAPTAAGLPTTSTPPPSPSSDDDSSGLGDGDDPDAAFSKYSMPFVSGVVVVVSLFLV